MSQATATHSKNYNKIKNQVFGGTPDDIINAIATQLDRAQDAAKRIKDEGSVVRDMRGSVVEHPAIAIELKATKVYTDLLAKWYDATE